MSIDNEARIAKLETALREARAALARTILSSINGRAEVDTEHWNELVRIDIAAIDDALSALALPARSGEAPKKMYCIDCREEHEPQPGAMCRFNWPGPLSK